MPRPVGLVDERPGRRNQLIDGRGRKLPLLIPSDVPPDAPAMVAESVRLANLHRFWPQIRIFAITCASLSLVSVGLNYFWTIKLNPCLWWIAVIAISGRVGSYGGRRKVYDNAVNSYRLLVAAGMCPSCGYGIEGVPEDEDGITVCPECAGAWKTRVSASPPAPSGDAAHQTPALGSETRA